MKQIEDIFLLEQWKKVGEDPILKKYCEKCASNRAAECIFGGSYDRASQNGKKGLGKYRCVAGASDHKRTFDRIAAVL